MTALRPVQPTERIQSLDIVRGFALLGILIPGFGLLLAAAPPADRDDGADAADQLLLQTLICTTLFYGWGFGGGE